MVDHEWGLTCLDDDIAPKVAFGVDEISGADGQACGDVYIAIVHHRDDESGASAHGGVDGVSAQA